MQASGREPVTVKIVGSTCSVFRTEMQSLAVSETTFILGPGESAHLDIVFSPSDKGYYSDVIRVFVDGKPLPYAVIEVTGWATAPYLSFSEPSIRLPVTPLGVTASSVVLVRATGYGKEMRTLIRAALPSLPLAPLELTLPEEEIECDTLMPITVSLNAETSVSFDAPIVFYDSQGTKYVDIREGGGMENRIKVGGGGADRFSYKKMLFNLCTHSPLSPLDTRSMSRVHHAALC